MYPAFDNPALAILNMLQHGPVTLIDRYASQRPEAAIDPLGLASKHGAYTPPWSGVAVSTA